jgi:hypothetical protein
MLSRILLCPLLLALGLLALPSAAHAQRLEDGKVKFELDRTVRSSRLLRNDLFKGVQKADPQDKEHQAAIDIAAKEAIYPLWWDSQGTTIARGKINRTVEEFAGRLAQMSRSQEIRDRTTEMQQVFCRKSMDRIAEIIEKGKAVVGVNAAMMLFRMVERRQDRGVVQSEKSWADEVLPRLGDNNGEHLAGLLVTLLQSPKANDGVKYYLFRAMSSLLGLPTKTPLLKKATEEKLIQAALDFVDKPLSFTRSTPREEIGGYQVLRREAIKVVAQASSTRVGDNGKPALTLARIAAADATLKPPPHISERIEATIGLAQLVGRTANKGDLEADYAAAVIARGVQALGLAAGANIDKKGLERARPWRVDAARLLEAVDLLKAVGMNAYVADAIKQCHDVLEEIEKGSAGQANKLGEWLESNPPKSPSLYKGDKSSTVKPGATP